MVAKTQHKYDPQRNTNGIWHSIRSLYIYAFSFLSEMNAHCQTYIVRRLYCCIFGIREGGLKI